jgi:hypothetical protein
LEYNQKYVVLAVLLIVISGIMQLILKWPSNIGLFLYT